MGRFDKFDFNKQIQKITFNAQCLTESQTKINLSECNFVKSVSNRKYGTIAVSQDITKTFDSVCHSEILYKCQLFGFDGQICRMVAIFLGIVSSR